jgi:hypothetical protein
MKCILCAREAITTAAHVPVCQKHDEEYQAEAKQYLDERPFYERLRLAAQRSMKIKCAFEKCVCGQEFSIDWDCPPSILQFARKFLYSVW